MKAPFINTYMQQRALDLINAKKINVRSIVYETRGFSGLEEVLADANVRKLGKFIINTWIN